jgi:hypothetical protein
VPNLVYGAHLLPEDSARINAFLATGNLNGDLGGIPSFQGRITSLDAVRRRGMHGAEFVGQLLRVEDPWKVVESQLDLKRQRVEVRLEWEGPGLCPEWGHECPMEGPLVSKQSGRPI